MVDLCVVAACDDRLAGGALVEEPKAFSSRRLLKECRSFVRHRNGKSGAQAGAHDDCVMAMAIALSAGGGGERAEAGKGAPAGRIRHIAFSSFMGAIWQSSQYSRYGR